MLTVMTQEEKLKELKGKRDFVAKINDAFAIRPAGSSVASVEYEVYHKKINDVMDYYQEYLVVTFSGGAISVRVANGNSNTANFREIGKLIDGGYYSEVRDYNELEESGFKHIEF